MAAAVVASLAVSTGLSIIPGIGWLGASAIMASVCYAVTLSSGFVYMKVLAHVFRAGKRPEQMSASDLKGIASRVASKEEIKELMKGAKQEFKKAKARGKIRKG